MNNVTELVSSKDSDVNCDSGSISILSSGDLDSLRSLMHQLLRDCGWQDDIRKKIHNILDTRGVNQVSEGDVIAEIIPLASKLVPKEVRCELEKRVRDILLLNLDI
ncbi:enhancer of yellow 2b transcription factor-like [Drosophila hydei]|uniref:Enhancer of yellow 2b transcription factor-like n=1 Tax=Drosophila hydei TaxID=7224 RepID=A0A6J1LEA7_DROHY|nr:enhancer of yellow 2b transcription factor-like [Drosophila hydei]